MRRLMHLIAVIFAFAAVGGVANSNAMAFSTVHMLTTQVSTCSDASPAATAVMFKACGKKSSGIVMPCAPQLGMLVSVGIRLPAASVSPFADQLHQPMLTRVEPVHLRPPKTA
jgi:hypothetical protein